MYDIVKDWKQSDQVFKGSFFNIGDVIIIDNIYQHLHEERVITSVRITDDLEILYQLDNGEELSEGHLYDFTSGYRYKNIGVTVQCLK